MAAKKNEVIVRYITTPIEPLLTSVRFLPNYIELIPSISNTLICIFRLLPYSIEVKYPPLRSNSTPFPLQAINN